MAEELGHAPGPEPAGEAPAPVPETPTKGSGSAVTRVRYQTRETIRVTLGPEWEAGTPVDLVTGGAAPVGEATPLATGLVPAVATSHVSTFASFDGTTLSLFPAHADAADVVGYGTITWTLMSPMRTSRITFERRDFSLLAPASSLDGTLTPYAGKSVAPDGTALITGALRMVSQ